MKKLLVISALVDMAIVYGLARLCGFNPSPKSIVIGVIVCYAISHLLIFNRRKG
jgi:hypothetical protein